MALGTLSVRENSRLPIWTNKGISGFNIVSQRTIDDAYVDGVSLTTGTAGHRHHIWTFASAYSEGQAGYQYTCPCTSDFAMRHTGFVPPPFISQDYFCDIGAVKDSL